MVAASTVFTLFLILCVASQASSDNFDGPSGVKCQKFQGIPGFMGYPGPPGELGTPGNDGSPGFNGFKGLKGRSGGARGAEKGAKGIVGDRLPGLQGLKGFQGASGHKGPTGHSGLDGNYGRQGLPGVGQKGLTGETGPSGSTGEKGHAGDVGDMGEDGVCVCDSPAQSNDPPSDRRVAEDYSAFSVSRQTGLSATNGHVIIDWDHVFTNAGENFNADTGIFNCTIPGYYYFTFHIHKSERTSQSLVQLLKNHNHIAAALEFDSRDVEDSSSNSVILHLESSDQIWLRLYDGTDLQSSHNMYTSFSGYLLHAG